MMQKLTFQKKYFSDNISKTFPEKGFWDCEQFFETNFQITQRLA